MMNLVLTVVYLIQSAIIVRSSLPISDPDNPSAVPAYNLIDTKPSCFDQGICPMFPPGGQWSVFPNAEEKYQHLLFNLHRMFANHSLNIDIGMYSWYDNNGTSLSYFYDGPGSNCGTSSIERKPLYWYSDANQAARFLAWDRLTCNSLLSDQDHDTCQEGLDIEPIWGSGSVHSVAKDRCSYFGDCSYSGRANAFCHDQNNDDCWFYTESICDGNQCLEDAQCDPIFQRSMSRDPAIPRTTYVGTGFVEGNDFNSAVFSPFTIGISYPLPIGSHYDERMRLPQTDRNPDGKYFVLMLEYFDESEEEIATDCYALYDRNYHNMDILATYTGIIQPSNSMMFRTNFNPPSSCQPYAFICKTSDDNFYRLPEDPNYYFGSADALYKCEENHYYFAEGSNSTTIESSQWIANGGPSLSPDDIWYYYQGNECIGCDHIDILQCWEECILSDFLHTKCNCASLPTISPTELPTVGPTFAPTDNACENGLDLIFIIDSSGSVWDGEFKNWRFEIDLMKAVVDSSLPADKARVGVINFSGCAASWDIDNCRYQQNRLKKMFGLADYGSPYNDLQAVYDRINQMGPDDFNGGFTWTREALDIALTEFQGNSTNEREKVIILVTDGEPSEDHEPCKASTGYISDTLEDLRNEGVRIITAGIDISNDTIDDFFRCIVQDPDDFHHVPDFDELLTTFMDDIKDNICAGIEPFPDFEFSTTMDGELCCECMNPRETDRPGCDEDLVCQDRICEFDSFCCNNHWDALCANHAIGICGVNSTLHPVGPGDPITAHPTKEPTSVPGTVDPTQRPTTSPTFGFGTIDPTRKPSSEPTRDPINSCSDCSLYDILDNYCQSNGQSGNSGHQASYNAERTIEVDSSGTETDSFSTRMDELESTMNSNMIMMMVYFTLINVLISGGMVFAYHKLYLAKGNGKFDMENLEDNMDDSKEEEVEANDEIEIGQVTTS